MKKLTFLFAAFLLGLFVSITIHACGGDKSETEISGGGGNNSGDNSGNNMWTYGSGKITHLYITNEDGVEHLQMECKYDSQKRLVSSKEYGTSGITMDKVLVEHKNFVYDGAECSYEHCNYNYNYDTGELEGVTTSIYREVYLQ